MAATALLAGPATALADNDAESASSALVTAVKSRVASARVSGRSVETQCSGKKGSFKCSWWVIKSSRERFKAAAPKQAAKMSIVDSGILARLGEGNAHNSKSRIFTSGRATASYVRGGFSFSICERC